MPMELELKTPQQRLQALRGALLDSVRAILHAAEIFKRMAAAGDDLSTLPLALVRTLSRVADQKMLPEVYIQLDGRLRQHVQLLPLADQKRIVEGQPVPLVIRLHDGEFRTEQIDSRKLTPAQLNQVFADGMIRTDRDQRLFLESVPPTPVRTKSIAPSYAIDQIRRGVIFNGEFIPANMIREWAKILKREQK